MKIKILSSLVFASVIFSLPVTAQASPTDQKGVLIENTQIELGKAIRSNTAPGILTLEASTVNISGKEIKGIKARILKGHPAISFIKLEEVNNLIAAITAIQEKYSSSSPEEKTSREYIFRTDDNFKVGFIITGQEKLFFVEAGTGPAPNILLFEDQALLNEIKKQLEAGLNTLK